MNRSRPDPLLDHDGLQADVMRFMAIIAFCLIAMLALVKNMDQNSIPEVDFQAADTPVTDRQVVPRTQVAVKQQRLPTTRSAEPPTAGIQLTPPIEPVQLPQIEPSQVRPTDAGIERPTEAIPNSTEPAPLTLRFESDKTFLRLLAANQISLLASTDDGFKKLHQDFSLAAAHPSGSLFEVMGTSLPQRITRLFERHYPDPVYLVSLPPSTTLQLEAFLQQNNPQEASGTLVIHLDGHLSHES